MKRVISFVLSCILFCSCLPIDALAVSQFGEGNPSGVGGSGQMAHSDIMYRIEFISPNQYGLTDKNWRKWGSATERDDLRELYVRVFGHIAQEYNTGEGFTNPASLHNALILFRETDYRLASTQPNYRWGAYDQAKPNNLSGGDRVALYTYEDHSGNTTIYDNTGASFDTSTTGIYKIDGNSVGASRNSYSRAGGMYTTKNVIMQWLLTQTNNGKDWKADKAESIIDGLYNSFINSSSSAMVALRKDLASTFIDSNGASLVSSFDSVNRVLFEIDKAGRSAKSGVPYTSSLLPCTIETEQQAANIGNMFILSIAAVIANPYTGVVRHSYRNSRNSLGKDFELWWKNGGNCDTNVAGKVTKPYHMYINVESYAETTDGKTFRYDVARALSGVGSYRFEDLNTPFNINQLKYPNLSDDGNLRRFSKALCDKIKARASNYRLQSSKTDFWRFFMPAFIDSSGNVVLWSELGFAKARVVNAKATDFKYVLNLGYTQISYGGPNPGKNKASGIPNFKHDAEAFTDSAEVPKYSTGDATVYINLLWPSQLSDNVKKEQNIGDCVPWDSPDTEKERLLLLIDRINRGEVIANHEYAQLPVTLTIQRTIENEGSGSDGAIIDDNNPTGSTLLFECGKHHYEVVENTHDKVVIKFNIIPDGGNCTCGENYTITSPILEASGKRGKDAEVTINNCVISSLFTKKLYSRIKFKDTGIAVTEEEDETTTVHYDISYTVSTPTFKENKDAYGDEKQDKARNGGTFNGYGTTLLPNGRAYPDSDYNANTSKFCPNPVIRRSVTFIRRGERPHYTNFEHEKKLPFYSEIKTNNPSNETFEAMAGTPTTRDLYMSVGATDFRVYYDAELDETINGRTYRTYNYVMNISQCVGDPSQCAGTCGTCLSPCPGHTDSEGNTYTHSAHISHTVQHPVNHTWTFSVQMPIEEFSFFDMQTTELWRLAEWGIRGGEEFLTSPDPTHTMNTKCWGLNVGNYSSGNGRIIFNEDMNSNANGDKSQWGDNTRSTTISGSAGHTKAIQDATRTANSYKNAEPSFSGSVISDYMVLKTSEGYQVPYFYKQDFVTSITPSSAPDFSEGEGGSTTTSNTLKVDKVLTQKDFWGDNGDKLTCASEDNGWSNISITHGGYNGDYQHLGSKYQNPAHKSFINSKNPLADCLSKNKWSIDKYYPNQKKEGSGSCSFGKDYDNQEHIRDNIDIIDTTLNGEYDTGEAWAKYSRVMMHKDNNDQGEHSSYNFLFDNDGGGIWTKRNIPYFDGATEVNDIVIHDPVSAEYAIVIPNPEKFDQRTDAELWKGGDPTWLANGVCPLEGCQFSTLVCDTPLTPHTDDCYESTVISSEHVGGNNSHTHTADCNHVHTSSCYATMYWQHNSSCSYGAVRHETTTTDKCSTCGHSCGHLVQGSANMCANQPCMSTGSHNPSKCPYGHSCSGCNPCHTCGTVSTPICGKQENQCTGVLNTHKCTSECKSTYKKTLKCIDPHHYEPGEPTDYKDPKFHYPIGDSRCWQRCGDDSRHGSNKEVDVPGVGTIGYAETFINLDREFQIYYPFKGDFAEQPNLQGIPETTPVRGHGFVNNMNTREWTEHRWVDFPVNVIAPDGKMYLADEHIDLNDFSTEDEVFTFYCVLGNDEKHAGVTSFTSVAINSPNLNKDEYYNESSGETNKDRVDDVYKARHTANKTQEIDVLGYIGALTINDTGDFRFSNLFKKAKDNGEYLIPNLVPDVYLNIPNYIVGDDSTVRRDPTSRNTDWLDTYGKMFNDEGGKSGGINNLKEPLKLPLVPRYNNIPSLRNQPMRPGYQLYMDVETVGNYLGINLDEDSKFKDSNLQYMMQLKPYYYSLNLDTGEYTPVDVYYGVNNEYMLVNDYDYGGTSTEDSPGVKDHLLYLDWLNESQRRNFTNAEKDATNNSVNYETWRYGVGQVRQPNSERDVIGNSNVLYLNDVNRTFNGSEYTYGEYKNPGERVDERWFNARAQRWQFSLSLPSSSVFVESNKPCTEENIQKLQTDNRVIVGMVDIKVQGEVWKLQYSGSELNNGGGFQIFENGMIYDTPDVPGHDEDIPFIVYPPDKTSEDDVRSAGTH